MKGLQKLIETLTFAMPSIGNIGTLLFLIHFIFSIVGVYLFSEVKEGQIINDFNNFQNFGQAMLIVFRCSTGENWWQIMFDLSKTNSDCHIKE